MNKFAPLRRWLGQTGSKAPPVQDAGSLCAPAGVQFVPGEDVLLLAVTLPKMSAAQRRSAVAFAVEDRIARPLDEVHVALGPEVAPNCWLVGVIARSALPAARPGIRLLPDTLAVPVPPVGQWSVVEARGRILIRLADGSGLVTRAAALPILHQIAGEPVITLYGGQIAAAHIAALLPPVSLPGSFDLSTGQSQTLIATPLARRLIAVAALAVVGHLGILCADTISLARSGAALETQLRAVAGAPSDVAIDALLAGILAPRKNAPEAGFLALISATFAAVAPQSGSVSVRELRYGAAQNTLTLTLQAPDLGTLQQVETSLATAGLAVTSGPATNAGGTAEQELTLQGPPT